jgi:hypothetical protein
MKRLFYLGYYFKEMDWDKFALFLNHTVKQTDQSKLYLLQNVINNSLKYNISLLEYFQFGFYKDVVDKSSYAGTGYMYEYQKKMNPPGYRDVLEDKGLFLSLYDPFIKHDFALLEELIHTPEKGEELLKNTSGKLILKHTKGQCGKGVEVIQTADYSVQNLIEHLKSRGNDMVEEFVEQHPQLSKLSPSGLNTVRIITQINREGGVDILGARLRITVNSHIDNLAAGNLAAPIDLETGRIFGPAVYSDITKENTFIHPVTKERIEGFQIPFWKESLQLAKEAALFRTQNRSIGWDIAITESGPDLIEGNHDWCKLLWQLPVQKGLKAELDQYLSGNK